MRQRSSRGVKGKMRPYRLFVVGFLLVLAGAVLPFLMIMGIVPASLWLSFVTYISSVTGLFLGILGAATFLAGNRKHEEGDGFGR